MARAKTPQDLQIIPRKVNIDYLGMLRKQRYWHGSDPVVTHFFNALQATFPEGERFFIDSARDVRDRVGEANLPEGLAAQIRAFIRQEAWHGKEHDEWTRALTELGYDKMPSYDKALRDLRLWGNEHIPAMMRLSVTAASEHYTASIASLITYRKPWLLENAAPPFQQLLLYHAVEELEHKAVCFDLFEAAGGKYRTRMLGLFFAAIDIMRHVRERHIYLLRADGQWTWRNRLRAFLFIWGPRGLVWDLLPGTLAYMMPSFHPWQSDERNDVMQRFAAIWQQIHFVEEAEAA